MKTIMILSLCIPIFSIAQNENPKFVQDSSKVGILFEDNSTWPEVMAKAKLEKKDIFLEVNATWCLPCRKMDQKVFSKENVGKQINDEFISLKVQIDSSSKDSKAIIANYAFARYIKETFKIDALPTYLFLSSDGKPLHKWVGEVSDETFLGVARDAKIPSLQFYTLKNKFNNGNRDTTLLKQIVITAQFVHDDSLAYVASNAYLEKLDKNQRFSAESISFFEQVTQKINDRGFQFFYTNSKKINEVLKSQGYAETTVSYVLFKELCAPLLSAAFKNKESHFNIDKTLNEINNKYGNYYAKRLLVFSQLNFYGRTRGYSDYVKAIVEYVTKYGQSFNYYSLNNYAWEIFLYSDNRKDLKTAKGWMEQRVKLDNPTTLDTYANLLYKLGDSEKAIEMESKALKLEPNNDAIRINIDKMKNKTPTWK